MNTSEIIKSLAEKLDKPQTEIKAILESTFEVFRRYWGHDKAITLPHFGTFFVRKRKKRRSYNPAIKKFMLLPFKLVLVFRPSSALKERAKERRHD